MNQMQGAWGWGNFKPHSSEAPTRPWQGQWESHGGVEGSGWEAAGTWDQLSEGDNSHYEEFENVMRWDDSGAQEAFEIAAKIQESSFNGLTSPLSFPSPDLYIQVIDWDSREDLKLPDSAETFSQHGERTGQRKRGRKGGAFRRQFDRQDFTSTADQKQSGKPFLDPACFNEVKLEGDHTHSSNAQMLDVPLDSSQRDGLPCHMQSPVQDRSRSNWSARWSSQPHQRQNFASSNWQDHGRSNWDEGHNSQTHQRLDHGRSNWDEGHNTQTHQRQDHGRSNWDDGHNSQTHQSRYRWQPANVSSEPARGWGRGGVPHHSSHGLLNDPRYQSTIPNPGNQWMCQGEAKGRGFPQQPMAQFVRGAKEQHHVPTNLPDNSGRWRRPQQQPYHPWQ